jgi:adenosine deaminase
MDKGLVERWLIAVMAAGLTVGVPTPNRALAEPRVSPETVLNRWIKQHQHQPNALRALLQPMPKGADLHSHLSGAVYAEDYLKLAAQQGYCLQRDSLELQEPKRCKADPTLLPTSELPNHARLYGALLDRWSTRDVSAGGPAGHADFFGAFEGFSLLSSNPNLQGMMVASVANRAAAQSIHYLELMLTLDGEPIRQLGRQLGWSGDAQRLRQQLLAGGLDALVTQGRQHIAKIDEDRSASLDCGSSSAQPGCKVKVRFLQQTKRTQAPAEVFAQLLYAFELAQRSEHVVGINLVGPEDHPIAQRDYSLHMRMLAALRPHYPEVGIALHAGELTLNLVPPEELTFHIREAITIGGARRIGHGVSIGYETNARQLLALMAQLKVLVELCLTSNAVILGISNNDHPLLEYQQAGVPTALASDDEGVLRTDLTEQFVLAVRRYGLNYSQLKQLARNSLAYSFLPGESLWSSGNKAQLNPACTQDELGVSSIKASCAALLANSAKARLQWSLEADLLNFERQELTKSSAKVSNL